MTCPNRAAPLAHSPLDLTIHTTSYALQYIDQPQLRHTLCFNLISIQQLTHSATNSMGQLFTSLAEADEVTRFTTTIGIAHTAPLLIVGAFYYGVCDNTWLRKYRIRSVRGCACGI